MTDDNAVTCTKMAEPIEMPFTLWTREGQWKHYYVGCTLAHPGEYHWTVHVRPRCASKPPL